MRTLILASLLYAGTMSDGFSDIVYYIDYEAPTYTNGQQIGGGSTETISDSINGLSTQGLLIHDGGGINYFAPQAFTSGVHLVSWDFAIPGGQGANVIINAQLHSAGSQSILFDTTIAGSASGIEVEYGQGFPQRPSVLINIGEAYSFQVLMNLDANFYSFWLDGNLLEDAVGISSETSLEFVAFGQNQTLGLQAGIDNFRWEVVPEPSTMALLALAGVGLAIRARYSHTSAS